MTLMFEACRLSLDFLGSPGSQQQLMWRMRLGRLCHAGQCVFRGDICLEERRLHEALEDEVSASWQRKKKRGPRSAGARGGAAVAGSPAGHAPFVGGGLRLRHR